MTQNIKIFLSLFLRFGLSALLLWYLFSKIDVEKTLSILKTADMTYIALGAFVFVLINAILFGRWLVYIHALSLKIPVGSIARYFFIGLFGNLFLPSAIGGDVIKTIGLCFYTSEKAKVVASVLLDRLSGFAGMVVVATVSYAVGFRLMNDISLLFAILAMAVVSSLIVTVLFNEAWYSFCCRIFSRLPKIKTSLMQLHYDVALLKDKRVALYQAVGISCFVQVLAAVTFYFVGKALHQDIALIYLIIFMPLICVAAAMPSLGGLGVREAGAAFLLAKVGVDPGIAVSISLINFIFMVCAGLLGGGIYAFTKSPAKAAS